MNGKNLSELLRGAAALAMMLLFVAVSIAARADTFLTPVNAAYQRLQYLSNHLSASDKAALTQSVANLNGQAAELDQLQSQIGSKNQTASDAQSAYDAASAAASDSRRRADQANQDAQSRIHELALLPPSICGQMGGSVSGAQCVFSCPEDQSAVCSQKTSAFDGRMAALRSQIANIAQSIQGGEQQAEAAEREVSDKQTALQDAQSALADLKKQLAPHLKAFQQDLQTLNQTLAAVEKSPLKFHLGQAYRQAQEVLKHMNETDRTCYDTTCFDIGANLDGTLVAPPAPIEPSSVPDDKLSLLQTELQQVTSQYNDIHEKLRQAEANHDPGSGDLVKQSSLMQGKVEMAAYRLKSYHVDMQVAAPPR